jgi:hypothetical protein
MIQSLRAKRASETVLVPVDFTDRLDENTTLSGTPTVEELYANSLTISSISISGATAFDWRPIAANKALTFLLAGGTAGTEYTLRVTVSTDDSQTLMKEISFRVN